MEISWVFIPRNLRGLRRFSKAVDISCGEVVNIITELIKTITNNLKNTKTLLFTPEIGTENFPKETQLVSTSKKRLINAVTKEMITTDLKLFMYFVTGTPDNTAVAVTKTANKAKEIMLFDEKTSAKNIADDIILRRESILWTTEFPGKYLQNAKVFISFKHLCR